VLGRYSRELGLFSMGAAIRKMTGLPAQVFRLKDRGRLLPRHFADLVVFDPKTIIDRATYDSPTEPAVGVKQVYVNGRRSFIEGRDASARSGRLIGGAR
jgi:N-acyl-D-amino-acid deacylase